MLIQETHPSKETIIHNKYPKLVNSNEFSFFQRLTARIDKKDLGNGLFLVYCRIHRKYYVDHNHTNEETRCPICDQKWLLEHRLR